MRRGGLFYGVGLRFRMILLESRLGSCIVIVAEDGLVKKVSLRRIWLERWRVVVINEREEVFLGVAT
jgi:hypothetical protein